MKNTQKGFIGVGAIIAIIAIIAIAGGATYVVKHNNNAQKANKDYATDPYVEDSKIKVNEDTTVVNSNANATVTGTVQTPVGTVNVSGNAGTQAQTGEWFYVPELHARFKNVAGFTPEYSIRNSSTYGAQIDFTSQEFREHALISKNFAPCVNSPFGIVTFSTKSKAESEWQGYDEIVLGNGSYLNATGHQDACWYSPTTVSGSDQQKNDQAYMNAQFKLYSQFLHSAESY